MYSLKKISFLLFILIICSCTKKEEPKEEVIHLTCTGTEESKTESSDPKKPSFELTTKKSIVYKFTRTVYDGKISEWIVDGDSKYERDKLNDRDDEQIKRHSSIEVTDKIIKFSYDFKRDMSDENYFIDEDYGLEINRYTGEFTKTSYYTRTRKNKTVDKHSDYMTGKCEKSVQKF